MLYFHRVQTVEFHIQSKQIVYRLYINYQLDALIIIYS